MLEECPICGEAHSVCPLLEMSIKVSDEVPPSRARLTLPKCLQLSEKEGKVSVCARVPIVQGTQFGPLEARKVKKLIPGVKLPFRIFKKDKRSSLFLDTSNEDTSNWMCLVNPAEDASSQNLVAYQLEDNIYFSCLQAIDAGGELRVGYSTPYRQKMEEMLKPAQAVEAPPRDSSSSEDARGVQRKRGRPPKNAKEPFIAPSEVTQVMHSLPAEVAEGEVNKMAQSMNPRELGISVNKSLWTCSKCGAEYKDCLLFARHLQWHYRPAYLSSCGKRRLKHRRKSRIYGRLNGKNLSSATKFKQGGSREAEAIQSATSGQQQPLVNSSMQIGNQNEGKIVDSSELAAQVPLINQEVPVDVSEPLPSLSPATDQQENEAQVQVNVSQKRDRKRKGETIPMGDVITTKQYKAVVRHSSETASNKYNLRTTRKALILSEDELEASERADDDYDDSSDNQEGNTHHLVGSSQDTCSSVTAVARPVVITVTSSETLENSLTSAIATSIEGQKDVMQVDSDMTAAAEALKELFSAEGLVVAPDPSPQETERIDGPPSCVPKDPHSATNLTNQTKENVSCLGDPAANNAELSSHDVQDTPEKDAGNEQQSVNGKIHIVPTQMLASGEQALTCDLCSKQFERPEYLYRHLRKHTGEFTCNKCHHVFARKENLVKHNCLAVDSNPCHVCNFCGKSFLTEKVLKQHMMKHEKHFLCKDCGKSYSTKEVLANHSCSAKLPDGQCQCSTCGKVFTKEIYLLKHLPVHTGQHSCTLCGKWLRSSHSLANHLRMCRQVKEIEDDGVAKCPVCYQEFTDAAAYRRHQFEHTHMYVCEMCGHRFRNKMLLKNHVCQEKAFTCDICKKSFRNKQEFKEHEASHREIPFKCSKCNKGFSEKELLEKHSCEKARISATVLGSQNKPVSLVPFVCEICGSFFSSTSSLSVHKKLHGEKKFACKVCQKRFHRKDLLLDHSTVHEEPSFPCPSCKKLFKTRKSLDVHIRIHDGIKKFKCTTCGKGFFQKGNLQKHKETHNKGHPFACSFCQKTFGSRDYLNFHILEHTRGRAFSCGICGRSFIKEHQLRSHHKMFHSNQRYICKYCGLSLKLRHSLKRHLKRKHSHVEAEWKDPKALNEMLVTKNDALVENATEIHLVPGVGAAQGAEVLLTVASIDSQELQEAIASGRAKIKQGPTANTFEISMPILSEEAPEATVAIHAVTEEGVAGQHIQEGSQEMVEGGAMIRMEVDPKTQLLPASEMAQNGEILMEVRDGTQGEIVLNQDDLSELVQAEVQADASLAHVVADQQENAEIQHVELDGLAGSIIHEQQQIVIEGQDLPAGMHHIVFDTSALQQEESSGQNANGEGTLILEDGTILQHQATENGSTDLLLYVLTTSEVE